MPQVTLKKGERSRQVIIDAAYALIIDQGYAATSMRQIAGKSDMALGSMYNHFSSKEDVFRSIIQERHPFFQILPIMNSVPGGTLEEFVRNAAHTLIEQLGHHPDFLNLLLIEIVEFRGEHVPLLFDKFLPMALPLAKRAAGLDGTTRDIPAFILARAFLGMFFSYYLTDILMGPVLPQEMRADALDQFVDIFLHGILSTEIE